MLPVLTNVALSVNDVAFAEFLTHTALRIWMFPTCVLRPSPDGGWVLVCASNPLKHPASRGTAAMPAARTAIRLPDPRLIIRFTARSLACSRLLSDMQTSFIGILPAAGAINCPVLPLWSTKGAICHMSFSVGDTVVYPHHGAALIESIEQRVIKGEKREYLVLRVAQGDLTVRVPADNVDLVGVRDVVNQEGLDRVFSVLRQPYTEEPTNWSRRYKANLEKLASGDVIKVAEVVRDLWRREKDRGLSAGEKRMLAKARQILVSELALAEQTNEDKAESLLDEVLAS